MSIKLPANTPHDNNSLLDVRAVGSEKRKELVDGRVQDRGAIVRCSALWTTNPPERTRIRAHDLKEGKSKCICVVFAANQMQ